MKQPKILILHSPDELFKAIRKEWLSSFNIAKSENRIFTAALSGGSTPEATYQHLNENIDKDIWKQSAIYQVDDRFIPHTHKDSNALMIRKAFADLLPNKIFNFFPFAVEKSSPELTAKAYEELIKNSPHFTHWVGNFPVFDILIMGIGTDGHTASLFPETGAIENDSDIVIPVKPKTAPYERISLTRPVLTYAKKTVFLITGEGKASIVKELLQTDKDYPASRIIKESENAIVVLDRDAAQLL